jgi:hypothetical protein
MKIRFWILEDGFWMMDNDAAGISGERFCRMHPFGKFAGNARKVLE